MFKKVDDSGIFVVENPFSTGATTIQSFLFENRKDDAVCFVVFPHEWKNRSEQIISHVRSYSDSNCERIFARKCVIKEIQKADANLFFDLYHIQGSNRLGIIFWGIFYNDEMLGVLSLGRHSRQNSDGREVVLDRLCFKTGFRIVGGASKLFSVAKTWSMKNGFSRIISFSDNRLTLGTVYERLGFAVESELPPDYFYLHKDDVFKYFSKQSQKKSNCNCPDDMTEKEWASSRGYFQVFDGGKKRWVYKIRLERSPVKSFSIRKHGYYQTKKSGIVYYSSSYELRACLLLDEMPEVKTYYTQMKFIIHGRTRYIDFLVERTDGSFLIIESKPFNSVKNCELQIKDNREFAIKNGWDFVIWTEVELGFSSEHYMQVWADEFCSKISDIDYLEIRKRRGIERSKKYYREKGVHDRILIFCDFCKESHNPLRRDYNRIVKKRGRFVCIKENGSIVGKMDKSSLKKENPYAIDGKKRCNSCKEIMDFKDFWVDRSKSDGYATRCVQCARKAQNKRYQKKS